MFSLHIESFGDWHGKIKRKIQRLCTESKKLARLLNLLLSEWLVEVRDAII